MLYAVDDSFYFFNNIANILSFNTLKNPSMLEYLYIWDRAKLRTSRLQR